MKRKMVYVIRRNYPNDSGEREYLSNGGHWVKSRENLMTFATRERARLRTVSIGAGVPWGIFADVDGFLLAKSTIKKLESYDYKTIIFPEVDRIIFSPPYTIVIWKDDTKTKVKVMDGDTFDEGTGFAAALAKRIYGSHHQYKKFIKKAYRQDNTKEKK